MMRRRPVRRPRRPGAVSPRGDIEHDQRDQPRRRPPARSRRTRPRSPYRSTAFACTLLLGGARLAGDAVAVHGGAGAGAALDHALQHRGQLRVRPPDEITRRGSGGSLRAQPPLGVPRAQHDARRDEHAVVGDAAKADAICSTVTAISWPKASERGCSRTSPSPRRRVPGVLAGKLDAGLRRRTRSCSIDWRKLLGLQRPEILAMPMLLDLARISSRGQHAVGRDVADRAARHRRRRGRSRRRPLVWRRHLPCSSAAAMVTILNVEPGS